MVEAPTLFPIEDGATEENGIAPHYSAERIAAKSPERYALAVRFLFEEKMSDRAICKLLKMSPNTLAAIERREMRINPERLAQMRTEEKTELKQLKRMCRAEIRARFLDEKSLKEVSLKEMTALLKSLDDMDADNEESPKTNRSTGDDNDYISVVAEWSDGFGAEENSAGGLQRGETVGCENNACETVGSGDRADGNPVGGETDDREPVGGETTGGESEVENGRSVDG